MPSIGAVFAMILFGIIGFAAFMYGKNSMTIKPLIIGITLMIYPYFVSDIWFLYGIGALLTAGLFYPKP